MKCASIPVAEIGIARNPVRRRFVAYLDVQVLHLLDQKDPFQCPAIQIEKLAGGLVLARPATRGKKIFQPRFLLHLSEFLGADRPTVDGPIVTRSSAENAASAPTPAGGRIEKNDERDDRGAGDQHPKPLLMPPNVSEHKLEPEIQARTLPAPLRHGQTQNKSGCEQLTAPTRIQDTNFTDSQRSPGFISDNSCHSCPVVFVKPPFWGRFLSNGLIRVLDDRADRPKSNFTSRRRLCNAQPRYAQCEKNPPAAPASLAARGLRHAHHHQPDAQPAAP